MGPTQAASNPWAAVHEIASSSAAEEIEKHASSDTDGEGAAASAGREEAEVTAQHSIAGDAEDEGGMQEALARYRCAAPVAGALSASSMDWRTRLYMHWQRYKR